MKPSHLREMHYRKECKRSFTKFVLFLDNLFEGNIGDIENQYQFYLSAKWHGQINYHDVDKIIDNCCNVETMCQYTKKIREYKTKKRYSTSQD